LISKCSYAQFLPKKKVFIQLSLTQTILLKANVTIVHVEGQGGIKLCSNLMAAGVQNALDILTMEERQQTS